MNDNSEPFVLGYADKTEAALLSAVHIARQNWDVASPEERVYLQEIYRLALRALTEHLYTNPRAVKRTG